MFDSVPLSTKRSYRALSTKCYNRLKKLDGTRCKADEENNASRTHRTVRIILLKSNKADSAISFLKCFHTAGDFRHLRRNRGLAFLVVHQGQGLDDLPALVGGIFHGYHTS